MPKRKLTEKKSGEEVSSSEWTILNQTLYKINRILDLMPTPILSEDEAIGEDISLAYLYLVDMTWNDVTPHYFNIYPQFQVWQNPARIELNKPDVNHKRAFEDLPTGYTYAYGWYLAEGMTMLGRFEIDAMIGGYHGYDATRACIEFLIADPQTLDVRARNDSVPWVLLDWSMSSLGYSNGSYNRPLSGYIIFTHPPSYSFYPSNPVNVFYNMITGIVNRPCNILYGYEDGWEADWDIWASINRYAKFRNVSATEPPQVETLREIPLKSARAMIAKWDGEYRLWIRKGSRGLIVSLGSEIRLISHDEKSKSDINLNDYDRIRHSGREPTITGRLHTLKIKTDKKDRHRFSDTWVLRVFEREETVYTVFGDETWDGDKTGFYIASLT